MLAALALVLFGAAIVASVSEARARRREGADVWAEIAAARGGAVLGPFVDDGVEMTASGVTVRLVAIDRGEPIPVLRQTRTWARARVRPAPRLAAGRRCRRRGLARLDVAEPVWGDRSTRALWTEATRAAWARLPPGAIVHSDGALVRCETDGVITERAVIEAMIDVVAAVAAWDGGVGRALAGLPGAEPIDGDPLTVRLAPDGTTVAVRDQPDGSCALVMRVDRAREAAIDPARLPAAVAAGLRAAGAGAGALTITRHHVEWRFDGVERDPDRLRAALAALRALAGQSGDGPYR